MQVRACRSVCEEKRTALASSASLSYTAQRLMEATAPGKPLHAAGLYGRLGTCCFSLSRTLFNRCTFHLFCILCLRCSSSAPLLGVRTIALSVFVHLACCVLSGSLGSIDAKYDVAITTSCGALDSFVVQTVAGGQACLDHLRRIGARGRFIVLDEVGAPASVTLYHI